MSDKPEALRLADALADRRDWYEFDPSAWCPQAAAELRRLHAENEALKVGLFDDMCAITDNARLRALNAELVDALRDLLADTQHAEHEDCEDGPCPVREARAVLAKAKASK